MYIYMIECKNAIESRMPSIYMRMDIDMWYVCLYIYMY